MCNTARRYFINVTTKCVRNTLVFHCSFRNANIKNLQIFGDNLELPVGGNYVLNYIAGSHHDKH
jgi:hypothetical protein